MPSYHLSTTPIHLSRPFREALVDKENESIALEQALQEVKQQFDEAKKALTDLKKEALKFGELTEEHTKTLDALPRTLDEVDAILAEAYDKINNIEDNPEVLRRYEERMRQIAETREELENLNEAKDVKRQALDATAAPWKASLENILVHKVNSLFSAYMSELGCAGMFRCFLPAYLSFFLLLRESVLVHLTNPLFPLSPLLLHLTSYAKVK